MEEAKIFMMKPMHRLLSEYNARSRVPVRPGEDPTIRLTLKEPEMIKSNERAAKVRQEGNELYRKHEYHGAFGKYNESICLAETGSVDLGMGYANRSAIFNTLREYEAALVNIGLAKRSHYPEALMPKLLKRETDCRQKLAAGESKGTVPSPRFQINVEVNPKIPSLAKGIRLQVTKDFGRGMVTDRPFRAGDVILNEKCLLANVDEEQIFYRCSHCSKDNFHILIPCPKCVSFMYCGQECSERDYKMVHRFECPISDKLRVLSYGWTGMGPKLFFYGLGLFGDDIDKMMEYCESCTKNGGNSFKLDYAHYDPLEEFKDLWNVKAVPAGLDNESISQFASDILWDTINQSENPLLQSIVTTEGHRKFALQCIKDFARLACVYKWDLFWNPLFPVGQICNYSCDPNAVAMVHSGHMKIVILRPIQKGEQVFVSYGEYGWGDRPSAMNIMSFDCKCVICDRTKSEAWRARGQQLPMEARRQWVRVARLINLTDANGAAKLNAIQQYVQRYGYAHPNHCFTES